MTLTLGWWLAPTIVTLVALCLLVLKGERPQNSYGYAQAGSAGVALIQACAAIIVSLIAWLAYAVVF